MPYSEGVNIAGGIAGILADFIGRTVVRERAVETAPEGATRHEVRLRGLGSGGDIAGLADFVAGILAGDAAGM